MLASPLRRKKGDRLTPYYFSSLFLCLVVVLTAPSQAVRLQEQDDSQKNVDSTQQQTQRDSSTTSASTTATAPIPPPFSGALVEEHESITTKAQTAVAAEAHGIFCTCQHDDGVHSGLQELCPGISSQCRSTFCKPLCLRMGWIPRIDVHCDRAPGWKWCNKFAAQVQVAHKAVTSQFQARTCVNLGFCNNTESLREWVENHSFGNQYPNHHLPVKSCVHKDVTPQQSRLLCRACEKVIDVDIERGQCLPQFKTLQPGSLQERCLFMADVIGNRKQELLNDFKSRVCSCLGCCGDGKCFFRNHEEHWMASLIEMVQSKVSAELELEGWVSVHKANKDSAQESATHKETL